MDSGFLVLLLTFLITSIFIVVFQLYLYRRRKRHEAEYSTIWERFDAIKNTRNFEEMIELGNKLAFSTEIKPKHLEIVHAIAIKHEQWHPEFETLKSNAYNKLAYWGRITSD